MSEELKSKLRRLIKAAEAVIEHECKIKDGLDSPYLDLAVFIESLSEDNLKELE